MKDGFLTIAALNHPLRVADCAYNGAAALTAIKKAAEQGAKVAVLPRLCLTGATCGDLYRQQALISAAWDALMLLKQNTRNLPVLILVGLPVRHNGGLYDCTAALFMGKLLWLRPAKAPNAPFDAGMAKGSVSVDDAPVPFGHEYHLTFPAIGLCAEVAFMDEGSRAPLVLIPDARLWRSGSTHLEDLRIMGRIHGNAVVYAAAGVGESTSTGVMDGRCAIFEQGEALAMTEAFTTGMAVSQVDAQRLTGAARGEGIAVDLPMSETVLTRAIDPMPFLLKAGQGHAAAKELLMAQAHGLAARLSRSYSRRPVIGVSGGVDSTLALLVAAKAVTLLGQSTYDVLAVTMPCFGTSNRTYQNALALCEALGVELREIPLGDAVMGHLKDIGHDGVTQNAAYENAQARERTQVLMDLSNMEQGLVVGTGDLSELALGWATYNGDHMSMYSVNGNLPKTLIRQLLLMLCEEEEFKAAAPYIRDIVDTPVSPELLPGKDGEIAQITEEVVGPYELHDFFLYYHLRFGFAPKKIFRLACSAFSGKYDAATIGGWMELFYKRFFASQFKRSCQPDGPTLLPVGLAPRGQWMMPSDASSAIWLGNLE